MLQPLSAYIQTCLQGAAKCRQTDGLQQCAAVFPAAGCGYVSAIASHEVTLWLDGLVANFSRQAVHS